MFLGEKLERLDSMILEVFSNRNDSVVLSPCGLRCCGPFPLFSPPVLSGFSMEGFPNCCSCSVSQVSSDHFPQGFKLTWLTLSSPHEQVRHHQPGHCLHYSSSFCSWRPSCVTGVRENCSGLSLSWSGSSPGSLLSVGGQHSQLFQAHSQLDSSPFPI